MTTVTRTLLIVALVLTPTRARAETTSKEDAPDHWYGWKTLIADGGSLAVGVTGGIMDLNEQTTASTALLYTAAVGYVAAAPTVHWATGHVNAGFWSLGLRVGLPAVFGSLGYVMKPCSSTQPNREQRSEDFACVPYAFGGAVLGALLAVALDNAVIAREPISPPGEATSLRFSISPVVDRREVGVVLRGAL